jgi:hypothetical protein
LGSDVTRELGLPPVDQVGYVVGDLDRALEVFGPLFGPFATFETTVEGALYRGRPADVTLRMGFGRSGPLEIELIEVVRGESPHRERLEKHGEGVHHVRFRVPDLAAAQARLCALGFEVIWSHAMPKLGIRWAYLEGPEGRGGALVELYQNPHPS